MPSEATFSYSTAPLPIKPRKQKYREASEDGPLPIGIDPRVVRGNTHALARNIATFRSNDDSKANTNKSKSAKSNQIHSNERASNRPTYIFDVQPFVSADIDLSSYLVDNAPSKKITISIETQSDAFKDPVIPTKPFIPRKTGIDKETQIEDLTELFDFDAEVVPMLEVLVHKTIEQALFEIQSEAELYSIEEEVKQQQEAKQAEIEWTRSKENEFREEVVTKDKLRRDRELIVADQRSVRLRVAGTQAMRQLLPSMLAEIEGEMFAEGHWLVAPVEEMRNETLPVMLRDAKDCLDQYVSAQLLLDELLLEAQQAFDALPEYIPKPVRKITIKIVLQAENFGTAADIVLKPMVVQEGHTVRSVEARIEAELSSRKIKLTVPQQGFLSKALGRNLPLDESLVSIAFPDNIQLTI